MKINGNGQAKILSPDEMNRLFDRGFKCARDKALFGICRYTACRFSEARKVMYIDAFNGEEVRSKIMFRKKNTKGKRGTREVDVHPNLAMMLEEYRHDSISLIELLKSYGRWSHFGPKKSLVDKTCPRCGSEKTNRDGIRRDYRVPRQRYQCKECNFVFEPPNSLEVPSEASWYGEDCLDIENELLTLGVDSSTTYGFLFLNEDNPYLFPGREGEGYIAYTTPQEIFSEACKRVEIVGASTHSFRRTVLTELHNSGVPLKVIQKISGHESLEALQRYLEVTDQQLRSAIYSLKYSIF